MTVVAQIVKAVGNLMNSDPTGKSICLLMFSFVIFSEK